MSVESEVKPKVTREPPEWYAKLPKNVQAVLGLVFLFGLCALCSLAVKSTGILEPVPTTTPAPPTATVTPSATATPAPTETPEATADPSPTPDMEGAGASVKSMLEGRNEEAGIDFFGGYEISQGGARLTVTVSDDWYLLADFQKERLVESVADQYSLIAAGHGLLGEDPGPADYPTTSFVSVSGKEVAFKSTMRTKINE